MQTPKDIQLKSDFDDSKSLRFCKLFANPSLATNLSSYAERGDFYMWSHVQIQRRKIDTYFYRAAADVTGAWFLYGGLNGLDNPLIPKFVFPETRSFLMALSNELLNRNIITIGELLIKGVITTPNGSTQPISAYGQNLDSVLLRKEQTFAQKFLDSRPNKSTIVKTLNEIMLDSSKIGFYTPYPEYWSDARKILYNTFRTFKFDYGNIEHRIIIGQAYVKHMRERKSSLDLGAIIRLRGAIDSGLYVIQGEKLRVSATGKVTWFKSPADCRKITCDADGTDVSYGYRKYFFYLLPPLPKADDGTDVNDGSLCGVVKTVGGLSKMFLIGKQNTVEMPDTGRLFLFVNDSTPEDNEGSFDVKVTK